MDINNGSPGGEAGWALPQQDVSSERCRIGDRLIRAGYMTEEQRNAVLAKQEALQAEGRHLRFGSLAVKLGFCNDDQIENLPGFLGERLVTAGLLTVEQRKQLVGWQKKLQDKGINIRFGDLTVSEGFCTAAEIEAVMRYDSRTCCNN